MKDVVFIDATNASGAGIVDKLFSNPNTKIILIDEIEKMKQRMIKTCFLIYLRLEY